MVDREIKDKINAKIDELEKYAYDHIEPCPGRNIYYDMVDAVGICRAMLSGISESEGNLSYVNEAIKMLKNARANYRFSAVDEGGYGIVTFHQVIDVAEALHKSLGGDEEAIKVPQADYLETQILYMPRDAWEQCFRTFALQDYVGCAVESENIIVRQAAAPRREVLLLWLISLQRTYQSVTAEQTAKNLMLPANYNEPFLCALIEMTIDTKSADEAAALAQNDEELCQFNFYHGQKLLTENDESAAFHAFRACADTEADCDERYLALAELNSENRAAIVSVYQLILRAKRHGVAGNRDEAIALYTQAYELARQYIGDADAVTESIGLRLAFY
jgi:hypothetical protein